MKKFVLGFLCAVWLMASVKCAVAFDRAEAEKRVYMTQQAVYDQEEEAFNIACKISQYDCERAPDPLVIYSDLSADEINGYYPHAQAYVGIDISYKGTQVATVLMVHEFIHYLQWIHRDSKIYDTPTEDCRQEEEAHNLAYEVAQIMGIEDHPEIFRWDDIKDSYECK